MNTEPLRPRAGPAPRSLLFTSPLAIRIRSQFDDPRTDAIAINIQSRVDEGDVPWEAAIDSLSSELLQESDRWAIMRIINEECASNDRHVTALADWLAAIRTTSKSVGAECESAQALHHAIQTINELGLRDRQSIISAAHALSRADPDPASAAAYLALISYAWKGGMIHEFEREFAKLPDRWNEWKPLIDLTTSVMSSPRAEATKLRLSQFEGHDQMVRWLFEFIPRDSALQMPLPATARAQIESARALLLKGFHDEAHRSLRKLNIASLSKPQFAERSALIAALE